MARRTTKGRFAVCVSNAGCDDLDVWKLYRVLPDAAAEQEDFLRVVDESNEDYLYSARHFVVVDLPDAVVKKLLAMPPSRA